MVKYNSVDKMYKLRQLFPATSEKVVYIGSKQEKIEQENENEFQKKAA
ncbi:MAG: hypothetical protein HC847_23480 [Hydrococcus sp. RU_2_2]|jgi:hypothetical protein|nr:hypothetical protein [Hydrococcus sp. RU_2_2]